MNIQLAIQHGTNILTDKRINTAKLDAEILMAKTLKKDRKYIILNNKDCLLYTSPSPRDRQKSRMPSSA